MGRYYDEHYDLLHRKLREMAALVEEVMGKTTEALASGDAETAREMLRRDEEIDRMENEIDDIVMKVFALQQPMAVDLRFLITALKINNDLERMGDQAHNIAKGIIELHRMGDGRQIVDFAPMAAVTRRMVRDCIAAFTHGDVALARQVCAMDDEVDDMDRAATRRLGEHLRSHGEDGERCLNLLLIARNLERIADLSTNIAEDVVYYIEGKVIRHAQGSEGPACG